MEIPIDNGFYESFSSPLVAQSCINLYPQNPQTQGAQSQGALFPTQGIDLFAELVGVCRGMYVFNGIVFSVNGTSLFQVNRNGSFVNKGTIEGFARVSMADNGVTMSIVVPDGKAYFLNSSVLSEITDAVFVDFQSVDGGITSVSSLDGRFVYTNKFEFFWTSIAEVNGGRTFDALDFSAAELNPDDILTSIVVKNELYILGTSTTEVFRNIGGVQVFQRVSNAALDKGLSSKYAVINFDNSFVFLGSAYGESPSIWRGVGGSAQKISTSAIDNVISDYTDLELSDSFVFKYAEGGNFFACFTISDKTFCYDAASSAIKGRPIWHERRSENIQYRVNSMVDAYGDIYVGDDRSNKIGKLNKDTYTEYGDTVKRSFSTSYLTNQGTPIFVSYVELKNESGVGLFKENSEGVNPTINMKFSDDGGHTYIDSGDRPLGKLGEYGKRQIWNRQGRIATQRNWIFEIIAPVKVVCLNLWLEVKGGSNGR